MACRTPLSTYVQRFSIDRFGLLWLSWTKEAHLNKRRLIIRNSVAHWVTTCCWVLGITSHKLQQFSGDDNSFCIQLAIHENKSSAVAEMGDRLATIDMGRKLGACPFGGAGPHLTQRRLGQGLPPYQVVSWCIQTFGHNRHGPKMGGCAPFWVGVSWVPI